MRRPGAVTAAAVWDARGGASLLTGWDCHADALAVHASASKYPIWVHAFGPAIARRLRARRPKPHSRWHLDEMFVRIAGKQMYLRRAVDAEGEILGVLVQPSTRIHRQFRPWRFRRGGKLLRLSPDRAGERLRLIGAMPRDGG